jgi:hypothetical protein
MYQSHEILAAIYNKKDSRLRYSSNFNKQITDTGFTQYVHLQDTCEHFIRTIPLLQTDPYNVEDIDTTMEDHVYDEAALICLDRPISMELPKKRKSSDDHRIERLIRGDRDSYEYYATIDQEKTFKDLGIGGVDYDDEYEEINPDDDGEFVDTIIGQK